MSLVKKHLKTKQVCKVTFRLPSGPRQRRRAG